MKGKFNSGWDKEWLNELVNKAGSEVKPAPGTKCDIGKYLPGIVCEMPATMLWGYGSIIDVCHFHGQLDPEGTDDELLSQLFALGDPPVGLK